jgi:GDP-4-dehydro-6-deoxy-D-mannose reductase
VRPSLLTMRCVVTGAAGFAGSHLVNHLKAGGHEVVAAVRREPDANTTSTAYVVADLLEPDSAIPAIESVSADAVYHLAALQTSVGRSWSSPSETIDGNIRTTLTVLEAVRAHARPPRLLLVSSSEVFGLAGEADLPLDEAAPQRPDSPYAISKSVTERIGEFYFRAYNLEIVTVRAFNHIGPGQDPAFVIPSFARQIADLEKTGGGELRVGNLGARRDFTDVRDMVRAYAIVMTAGDAGAVYNAGSGRMWSISDLLVELLRDVRAPIDVVKDPALWRPTDVPAICADASRLAALGWVPEIPLSRTLHDVLDEARARD